MLQPQISLSKDIGQQKVGSKSHNHFTNLQTMHKTNIRLWDCFYHNCFGIHHQQIQRVQNSFISLALRLPKYVLACLIHEASRLPYVRETHHSGPNHLIRMHPNPLLSIQSPQLGPTLHGTNTRHQFPQ